MALSQIHFGLKACLNLILVLVGVVYLKPSNRNDLVWLLVRASDVKPKDCWFVAGYSLLVLVDVAYLKPSKFGPFCM